MKISSRKETLTATRATIDIVKFLMAILVIGIHTEPFGFNIWLDRGFGIVTRLCVPFFFVASAYFFWSKDRTVSAFLKRIIILYAVWSLIYLPFDISILSKMSFSEILRRYLWDGNEHALWYLCGSIIGFLTTYSLLKVFKPKAVFIISVAFLLIGCMKSTWSPLFEHIFHKNFPDYLGSRNGLFYGFPYMALGMLIAKNPDRRNPKSIKRLSVDFVLSLFALAVESIVFVVIFRTSSTILWISVLPYTYTFFQLCNKIEISISREKAIMFRKLSTIIYVSQYLFIPIFSRIMKHGILFATVSLVTTAFGYIIIKLSENYTLRWLRYLY